MLRIYVVKYYYKLILTIEMQNTKIILKNLQSQIIKLQRNTVKNDI